mmetsp:Transcript_9273/g.23438  ORF Transcript_9273/g.23438 Transcript_9273/m.23438 type:complete len:306 (-) Transcript_9273:222-1139(-)
MLGDVCDAAHRGVHRRLHLLLRALLVVLAGKRALGGLHRLVPRVAHTHLGRLRRLGHQLLQRLHRLRRGRRHRHQHLLPLPLLPRLQPQRALPDRLHHRRHRARVVHRQRQQLRPAHAHRRCRLQRRFLPVHFHLHEVQHLGRRAPAAQVGQLVLEVIDALVHLRLQLAHVKLRRLRAAGVGHRRGPSLALALALVRKPAPRLAQPQLQPGGRPAAGGGQRGREQAARQRRRASQRGEPPRGRCSDRRGRGRGDRDGTGGEGWCLLEAAPRGGHLAQKRARGAFSDAHDGERRRAAARTGGSHRW